MFRKWILRNCIQALHMHKYDLAFHKWFKQEVYNWQTTVVRSHLKTCLIPVDAITTAAMPGIPAAWLTDWPEKSTWRDGRRSTQVIWSLILKMLFTSWVHWLSFSSFVQTLLLSVLDSYVSVAFYQSILDLLYWFILCWLYLCYVTLFNVTWYLQNLFYMFGNSLILFYL